MEIIDESTGDKSNLSPPPPPLHHVGIGKPLGVTVDPWIDYAVQRALITQKTITDSLESQFLSLNLASIKLCPLPPYISKCPSSCLPAASGPRRALYYNTLCLFVNEEALLARADAKEISLVAEKEMIRGRTKLRQAGKQIQGVIDSAYKIERQAGGLQDILKELPSRDESKFRSQVSNLALQAKRERKALTKEVTKIVIMGFQSEITCTGPCSC